jgi:UDP-N-acetylglucosamine/UDP-N-acetylgalactosamine diphosphorylase
MQFPSDHEWSLNSIEFVTRESLQERLEPWGQSHLLRFWDQLNGTQRQRLAHEILQIDWELVARLYSDAVDKQESDQLNPTELQATVEPPASVLPLSDQACEAFEHGEALLRDGQVGMILVAGGQGTRLGFPHPKGMYPLGAVSGRSLFQILIDKMRATGKRYGVEIPLYVMTSPATHDETAEFLQKHRWFGADAESVRLFCQGVMPSVDAETGKALLASRESLALSPDGHGGMLPALLSNDLLGDMAERGLRHLFYGQIDNPLLPVCDPRLLGAHGIAQSELTTLVVRKRSPLERVGNLVSVGNRSQIIEYSDLPESVAEQRQDDGSLRLWAGNIAVHVFDLAFLQRVAADANGLQFHRVIKKVPHLDALGNRIEPKSPNALKFERFVFDLLPLANCTTAVEGDRTQCFAPVKNPVGAEEDTPISARNAMIAQDQRLLRQGGATIISNTTVEINPLWAFDANDVSGSITAGTSIFAPTYFSESEHDPITQPVQKAA